MFTSLLTNIILISCICITSWLCFRKKFKIPVTIENSGTAIGAYLTASKTKNKLEGYPRMDHVNQNFLYREELSFLPSSRLLWFEVKGYYAIWCDSGSMSKELCNLCRTISPIQTERGKKRSEHNFSRFPSHAYEWWIFFYRGRSLFCVWVSGPAQRILWPVPGALHSFPYLCI